MKEVASGIWSLGALGRCPVVGGLKDLLVSIKIENANRCTFTVPYVARCTRHAGGAGDAGPWLVMRLRL